MSSLDISLALVETTTHTYTKARVKVEDNQVLIYNRRNELLATLDGDATWNESTKLYEGDGFTIAKMKGCGCGGTKVAEK